MEAHFYAGPGNVVLDSCDFCNLNWLDHGELMRIARAPDYFDQALRDDA
jgi:Zn-finger nucleic acid-binding protein